MHIALDVTCRANDLGTVHALFNKHFTGVRVYNVFFNISRRLYCEEKFYDLQENVTPNTTITDMMEIRNEYDYFSASYEFF